MFLKVRLRNEERKRGKLPYIFRLTGACSDVNGVTRIFVDKLFWSRNAGEATSADWSLALNCTGLKCNSELNSSLHKPAWSRDCKPKLSLIFFYSYRGYYSRKYEHDFYARKKYLQHVQNKNEEVRKDLDQYHSEKLKEQQNLAEDCARTEFGELAQNLHHLSSTKAIPGVYSAPYSQLKPQAFNVDIETHLKSTFKSNYQWRAPNKEKMDFFRNLAEQ